MKLKHIHGDMIECAKGWQVEARITGVPGSWTLYGKVWPKPEDAKHDFERMAQSLHCIPKLNGHEKAIANCV